MLSVVSSQVDYVFICPLFENGIYNVYCNVQLQVTDNYYRPDLTKAALARLSAVHRSLKVAKSGAKKRNRQAHKN